MKYIFLVILLIASFVAWMATDHGRKAINCWAYYDQCTAQRIEGITKEDCFKKDNVVAWLITKKICLVKNQEK